MAITSFWIPNFLKKSALACGVVQKIESSYNRCQLGLYHDTDLYLDQLATSYKS